VAAESDDGALPLQTVCEVGLIVFVYVHVRELPEHGPLAQSFVLPNMVEPPPVVMVPVV
jgi:hypothetical protein